MSGNANGSPRVTLTPFATGTYAGIVLFQARTNPGAITLSGTSSFSSPNGVLYAPAATLTMTSGSGQVNAALIVNRLTVGATASVAPTAVGAVGAADAIFASAAEPLAAAAPPQTAKPAAALDQAAVAPSKTVEDLLAEAPLTKKKSSDSIVDGIFASGL